MIFNLTPPESTAVEFIEQTLTDTQKAQARTNIGALSIDDVPGGGMELLGEAYTTSRVAAVKIPIPSGYTYYYMPLEGGEIDQIVLSYAASCTEAPHPFYFSLSGSDSGVTYDGNNVEGYSGSYSSTTFKPDISDTRQTTGYLSWQIMPCDGGYRSKICLFMVGSSKFYYGYKWNDTIYTLDQCTPTNITISAAYSLKVGTGATVYGIK